MVLYWALTGRTSKGESVCQTSESRQIESSSVAGTDRFCLPAWKQPLVAERCCCSFPSWPRLLALLRPSACPCATLCWPCLILFSYASPHLLEASRFQLWFLCISFPKDSYFMVSCLSVLRFVFMLPGCGQHLLLWSLHKGTF